MSKQFKAFVKKLLSLSLILFSAISFAGLEMSFEGKNAKLNLIISNTDASRRKGLMNQAFLKKILVCSLFGHQVRNNACG